MLHKDIKVGDRLLLSRRWSSTGPVPVIVLDTTVKYFSKRGVQVQVTDGHPYRFYGGGVTDIIEARDLARPGSEEARLKDTTSIKDRIAEITQELERMGFKPNSPRGFRVRASTNPTLIVSWEILDRLLAERAANDANASSALNDIFGDGDRS